LGGPKVKVEFRHLFSQILRKNLTNYGKCFSKYSCDPRIRGHYYKLLREYNKVRKSKYRPICIKLSSRCFNSGEDKASWKRNEDSSDHLYPGDVSIVLQFSMCTCSLLYLSRYQNRSRGKDLIDLCISNQLRIFNDRVLGDTFGNFTRICLSKLYDLNKGRKLLLSWYMKSFSEPTLALKSPHNKTFPRFWKCLNPWGKYSGLCSGVGGHPRPYIIP
jgi:hypothetical protein